MKEKSKLYISTLVIFWIIFAVFILLLASMFLARYLPFQSFIGLPSYALLSLLGLTLIVLAAKAKLTKTSKVFIILTGSGAAGTGISIVLHNLLFGLFIVLFGEGYWERIGIGDEPVFFILATIICPLVLLVGIIGSIVLIARKKVSF
ncbi:MAG: hypothetical protein PHQ09_04990 [Actinomycetota bacterium]|jgi:cytochrome b561|nr:hypothetical protein [Actinomycetota bacterium]